MTTRRLAFTMASTLASLMALAATGCGATFDNTSAGIDGDDSASQTEQRWGHTQGTCWYFNKASGKVVNVDASGTTKACGGFTWFQTCRDFVDTTVEIGCFSREPWTDASGRWSDGSPMGTGGMGAGNGGTMGTGGDMGAGNGGTMGTGGNMGAGNGQTVPTLASLGITVNNGGQALPGNWATLKASGVKIERVDHACNWAVRPGIYAFPDGVVYADAAETNINVFSHDVVRSFGCLVPRINGVAVQAPISEPLNANRYRGDGGLYEAPALADFGVAVDNDSHTRQGLAVSFADMVRGAVRISQADHVCTWAVRPLIYVFADGVVYSKIDGADFNVFSFDKARANGCFIPNVRKGMGGGTPSSPPGNPTIPDMGARPGNGNDLDQMGG